VGSSVRRKLSQHPYELFLQSNGIVERPHRTLLDEHFRDKARRTWFETVEEMQVSLDQHLESYSAKRLHQGRGMSGRTPLKAFTDGLPKRKEKTKTQKTEPKPETRAAA